MPNEPLPTSNHANQSESILPAAEAPTLAPPAPWPFAVERTLTADCLPRERLSTNEAGGRDWPAIPGYEILGELGRGGMGVVYKARHLTLKRLVALKMILAGNHAGDSDLARFRAEAEAAAKLQHPHIVQIYEVGQTQGNPFFCLELAEGGSLADKLDGTPLPPRQAAEFVETLAHAIHAAHQAGIVHRDLKPANILLATPAGAEPNQPWAGAAILKITDFGLAKKLGAEPGSVAPGGLTQSGAIMGTPSYMAPEQAGGKSREIGPAADVYALGAILYEMLTGRPPFRAETPLDTILLVVSEEPVAPRRLQPKVPRDLETICLKCLHKDRAKRYGSARGLAEDLQRFLAGEPIQARPIASWERVVKWARRRPAAAAVCVVSALAIVGLLAGAFWYNGLLSEERDGANAAKTEAERQRDFAKRALEDAQRQRGIAKDALVDAEQQRDVARQAVASGKRTVYGTNIRLAQNAWEKGEIRSLMENLQGLRPRSLDDKDLRGFEWYYLNKLAQSEAFTYRGHEGICFDAAFSLDGKRVASVALGGRDGQGNLVEPARVQVWEPATGQELFACAGHSADVSCVAFNKSGTVLASGGGAIQQPAGRGEIKLWDAATGKHLRDLEGMTSTAVALAFDPEGNHLAAAGMDPVIRIWDIETGVVLQKFTGHSSMVRRVAFSPDGKRLASASQDKTVRIWDVKDGKVLHTITGHGTIAMAVAFHPGGDLLVSVGFDKVIRIWEVSTGKQVRSIGGHTGFIAALAFSPDGKRLASAGGDKVVRIWDFATGQQVEELRGRENGINSVAYSRDGNFLLGAGSDGAVSVWNVTADQRGLRTLPGAVCMRYSTDGKAFAVGYLDGKVGLCNEWPDRKTDMLEGHTALVNWVALSGDGRWLASASDDKTIRLWDVAGKKTQHVLRGHEATVECVAFSPDNLWMVSAGMDKTLRVWNVADGRELHKLECSSKHHHVAVNPRSGMLASCGLKDTKIALWDAKSGKQVGSLAGHGNGIVSLAFSPDGTRLASGSFDGTVKVWDVALGHIVFELRAAGMQAGGVAFSADGQRLATGQGRLNSGETGNIKVWDAETGQLLLEMPGHSDLFWQVAFSPDGRSLAAASSDHTVVIWDGSEPPLPDTSSWKVLFQDDFKRAEVGPHWPPSKSWSLKEGWLCGTLELAEYQKLSIAYAGIAPQVTLPATVEVRFDCRVSTKMNVMAMFSRPGANKGVTAWLLAVPEHFLLTGAAVVWQGGILQFPVLTSNSNLELKPNTPYRIRVLREPRRITIFVDGVEVTSTALALLDTPKLTLGGMFGSVGSEIRIGNLAIRAPR